MKIPPRIGFIGIGIMGSAMAQNLIKNGYRIKIYNRTREKCYPLEKKGAEISSTVKEISKLSNVIITMVGNEKAMDDLCFGREGIIENLDGGSYLINMSTVSYDYTKRISHECFKKGIRFMDCPVSGSKLLAENASLIILCGCEENDLDYSKSMLLSMGKDIVYCGCVGNATVVKLCINLLLASMTSGLVESVNLCKKSGLSPSLIFDVIEKSPVLNCGYYKLKKNKLIENDFSPQFSLKNMLKDLTFINELTKNKGLDNILSIHLHEIFEKAFKNGFYDEDLISISKLYDKN